MTEPRLTVEELRTYFYTERGIARAVDGVSFTVEQGDTLGIVGESGCGKSVTALSILRLVRQPPGKVESGRVLFEGRDLLALSPAEMRKVRGNRISMIFQDPMSSLNPVFTVGEQVAESIRLHQGLGAREAFDRAIDMLDRVKIPAAGKRARQYPHQMSGGMRQRVMIAMALSCKPQVMIADEPTTALDVTIQAQTLNLLEQLKAETGTSVLLITHDLGVIAETARTVVVMYAGKVMEQAGVREVFKHPRHPYTEALLKSIPRADQVQERLQVIPGIVPSLLRLPAGCKFSNRCGKAVVRCFEEEPPLFADDSGHLTRCWLCA
jgi:oligopeptide/dipeptide ABC transporter ATP-binding protein